MCNSILYWLQIMASQTIPTAMSKTDYMIVLSGMNPSDDNVSLTSYLTVVQMFLSYYNNNEPLQAHVKK